MNRNYYCKVNSQEEADELLKKLIELKEPVTRTYALSTVWTYVGWKRDENNWGIIAQRHLVNNAIEVPASELIGYVTGKKVNKDALLEEARRRYPVGTKFKSALKGDKHPFQTIVKGNIYLDKVEGRQVIWNGDGCGFIYDDENWAEIVEEPKVETNSIAEEFVLPEYWFLRFKTKEVFDELCAKYAPDFVFFENAGICNNPTKLKLGNYYYLTKDTRYGEEITFDQFKKYVLKDNVKEEVKKSKNSDITWKIGDYVVFTEDWSRSKKGNIDKIEKLGAGVIALYLEKEGLAGSPLYNDCKLKVFPTLQEAQKFSDELLDKSKTSLSVEDLIEGEFYRHNENGNIFKWAKNKQFYLGDSQTSFEYADGCWEGPFSLANASEVKWLKTCIKQDKFIPQSELDKYDDEGNLMESKEYPEYYECIKPELWKNTIKSNNGNLIFSGNFITKTGNTIEHEHLHQYGHFKISTKAAYDAQFKKDERFKDGDWLVYIKKCGLNPSTPIKIGDVRQMIGGSFGTLVIYGDKDLSQYFRKALPHEIPVENSVKQYPYTPEESIKLDFEVKWKEPRYIGGVDSITATGWGIYEQMKKQPIQSRKTPDLIDKSKVEVKIKRTKVKQIKL